MRNKKYILAKHGNVFIPIGFMALIIVFASIVLVYYQVNIITENIRKDLFYASNSAVLSFDLQDLAYQKYTVDESKTREIIEYLLNRNYTETQGSINEIKVTDLKIKKYKDKVCLDVEINVKFNSIINLMGKKEHEFRMIENIKISLIDYEKEE